MSLVSNCWCFSSKTCL